MQQSSREQPGDQSAEVAAMQRCIRIYVTRERCKPTEAAITREPIRHRNRPPYSHTPLTKTLPPHSYTQNIDRNSQPRTALTENVYCSVDPVTSPSPIRTTACHLIHTNEHTPFAALHLFAYPPCRLCLLYVDWSLLGQTRHTDVQQAILTLGLDALLQHNTTDRTKRGQWWRGQH